MSENPVVTFPTFASAGRRTYELNRALLAGLLLLLLLITIAIAGRTWNATEARQQNLTQVLQPPYGFGGGRSHVLGTDELGRDILARVTVGMGTSLMIGVLVAVIAGMIGTSLGMLSGMTRGTIDRVTTFLADTQLTLPTIVLGIAVAAVTSPSVRSVVLVLIASSWVGFQRVVRLQASQLATMPFIEAAETIGASRSRVMVHHLLPNLLGSVAILLTQAAAAAMLFEATLTYVGAGLPDDQVSLGGMVADGRSTIFAAWWVSTIPGIFLLVATLAFILLGDGLSQASRQEEARSSSGAFVRVR